MQRAKRRIFSGAVCEQIVYSVPDRVQNIKKSKPRPRFKDEEERARHKLEMSRRDHTRKFNANFTPASLYSTLTMDDEYEVHTFKEARWVRDNYVRRLRYHYPEAKIMIYMGRGKATGRIHFHMVSDGIPKEDIIKLWGMGEIVRVENLREHNYYDGVDHGKDYTGLANYLFNHWTPEQGGHHYRGTRNLAAAEAEPATLVKRNYTETKPPCPPKGYIFIESKSTKYGYLYFKYVRQPEKPAPKKRGRPRKRSKEDPQGGP